MTGRSFPRTSLRLAAAIRFALVAVWPLSVAAPQALAQSHSTPATFDIPAGPLGATLTRIAEESGVVLSFEPALVEARNAPAISGVMTARQALQRALEGSGLELANGSNGTYRLQPVATKVQTMRTVRVVDDAVDESLPSAYAGGQVARGGSLGMLGNKDVMDSPFSQTSYTNKTIQDQQAQTVQDVLLNDPSILTKQNSASDEDGSVTIRGFSTTLAAAFGSLNGLAGMAPLRSPDMDYMERVEVLRGPSALLNGMAASGAAGTAASGAGGSYNLVTKQAGNEPLTRLTARYGSRSQLGAHLDVGRRFGADNQFGIRLNGAYRKGDTSVKPTSAEVGSAALNLNYSGERVRISADIAHQSNEANPQVVQQLVVSGVGGGFVFVPEAPDAGTSLNPVWSEQPSDLTLGMVRGEVDMTDTVTAYGAIGMQELEFSLIGPSQPTLRDANGTYGWNFLEYSNFAYDVQSMQVGLRGTAATGSVNHAYSLNLSQSGMETGEAATQVRPYTVTTNLYDPIFGPEVTLADPGDPKKTNESRVSSIGIADTLSILGRIQFTAGVRYQEVESDNFNTTTGAKTSSYESDAWSPAAGLVVKPWENVSLYANYIENLQRGTIVSSQYANSGEVFPPYVSEQYETGVKVDWGTVTTTLAAFQIALPNTIDVPDPDGGLPTQALNGELRNRGIELNAYGELMPGVRMMGGLTLIDGRQTKTQDGLYDGNREAGIPKHRTVIGGEWDSPFLQGLTLTGRVTYTGDQVVTSSDENLKIPSWAVLDLGARHVFDSPWNNTPITVRVNVDNVFDKDYWSGANFRYVQLGAPRSYRLSATFDF